MKNISRVAAIALVLSVVAASALAQAPVPETAAANITEGAGIAAVGGNLNWANYSELVLIPGSSLFGVKATSNYLYIGFTGGSAVDIGNMVLYTTARNTTTVTKVKKVTLGGVSDPSLNLTSTSVCPVQPVTTANPCIIKLDAVKGTLSPLDDYYFVIYFTDNTNNQSVDATGLASSQGSLSGYFTVGDETRIKAKGTLPPGYAGQAPYFLLYVASE